MQLNKKHFFLLGSLVLSLAGCANYTASILDPLSPAIATRSSGNEGVLVSWKLFDQNACHTYLGRDVIDEGYVPAQITIRNDSADPMYLGTGNFSIPFSSPAEVARSVHTSTTGRALGWGIPGLFIWPLLIPAVYDGIQSSNANAALDADYASKAIKEHIIQPYTVFNGVVFIPKGKIGETIDLFLVNQKTSEKLVFPELNKIGS